MNETWKSFSISEKMTTDVGGTPFDLGIVKVQYDRNVMHFTFTIETMNHQPLMRCGLSHLGLILMNIEPKLQELLSMYHGPAGMHFTDDELLAIMTSLLASNQPEDIAIRARIRAYLAGKKEDATGPRDPFQIEDLCDADD